MDIAIAGFANALMALQAVIAHKELLFHANPLIAVVTEYVSTDNADAMISGEMQIATLTWRLVETLVKKELA